MKLCADCLKGPGGGDGHGKLKLDMGALGHLRGTFVCTVCSTRWRRIHDGGTKFEWKREDTPAKS